MSDVSDADKDLLVLYFGVDLKNKILKLDEDVLSKPNKKPKDFDSLRSDAIEDRPKRGISHCHIPFHSIEHSYEL